MGTRILVMDVTTVSQSSTGAVIRIRMSVRRYVVMERLLGLRLVMTLLIITLVAQLAVEEWPYLGLVRQ